MAWTQPVFDRTQQDVLMETEKGFLNVEDLNRIEGNIEYLSDLMGLSYEPYEWSMEDMPTGERLANIRNGVAQIKQSFYGLPNTPKYTPSNPLNSWKKINEIEQILNDYHWMYTEYLAATNYVGELYSADQIGVI